MTSEDKTQDQKIADMDKRLSQKVPWMVFVWVIGIITAAIWYTVNAQSTINEKVHQNDIATTEVRGKIETIQNDVSWIRGIMEKQNQQAKR